FFLSDLLNDLLFKRDDMHDAAEGFGEAGCCLDVERLINTGEDAAIEQRLEHILGADVEFFSEIADSDALGNGDLARLALNRRGHGSPPGGTPLAQAPPRAPRGPLPPALPHPPPPRLARPPSRVSLP